MTPPIAVLDACVLYPAATRDLFMRMAVAGLIEARWTRLIHEVWITAVLRERGDLVKSVDEYLEILRRRGLQKTCELLASYCEDL